MHHWQLENKTKKVVHKLFQSSSIKHKKIIKKTNKPVFLCDIMCYLSCWHQVKRVQQKQAESLNKEDVVTVFPYQQEGECGGTHGKIAEHLQKNSSINILKYLAEKIDRIRRRPQW